jgi:hypothetical protein
MLPNDKAETLRQAVTTIRTIQRSAIADVGNHLIAAKDLLDHGQFGAWAAVELGMTVRSAERYMQAARVLEGKPTQVSYLPAALIYRLAAPSAPAHVVEQTVAEISIGIMPKPREIVQRLSEAVEAARRSEAEATKSPEKIARERKARESRTKREARKAAEHEARESQQLLEDQKTEARLSPLLAGIMRLRPVDIRALVRAFGDYGELRVLRGAIERMLAEAETGLRTVVA